MDTTKAQFVRVSAAYSAGSSRLIGRDDLRFGELVPDAQGSYRISDERLRPPRRIPGDFLGRIWALYGPPGSGDAFSIFDYDFVDRETRGSFSTAYSGDFGPSYGGGATYDGSFPPPRVPDAHLIQSVLDRTRILEVAKRFEVLLEQTALADCMLVQQTDFGLFRFGARAGKPFEEKMPFAESIDFYGDLVKRFGPERDVGAYHLAYPEQHIRWIWVNATDTDRKQRPGAIEFVRHAWERELEKLEGRTVKCTSDQLSWRSKWDTLDAQAGLVGTNTQENLRRLDRLREPPPLPAGALEEEAREEAEIMNLLQKALLPK